MCLNIQILYVIDIGRFKLIVFPWALRVDRFFLANYSLVGHWLCWPFRVIELFWVKIILSFLVISRWLSPRYELMEFLGRFELIDFLGFLEVIELFSCCPVRLLQNFWKRVFHCRFNLYTIYWFDWLSWTLNCSFLAVCITHSRLYNTLLDFSILFDRLFCNH